MKDSIWINIALFNWLLNIGCLN